MKDQILKIAGVKSEKEFYKKYPTEEAFMAKHGKKLEKLAMGKAMVNRQLEQLTDFSNPPIAEDGAQKFGFTKPESFGAGAGAAGMTALQNLDKIAGGISAIGQQKKNITKAGIAKDVSGLGLQAAAGARGAIQQHNFARPEDNLVQPGQLGAPQGTGTNFLQMKSGGEIQNTYAPYTLYDDLGYVPKAEFGEYFQDSGQAQVGSALGESIGSAWGPAGAAVGKFAGKILGNALGGAKDARKLKGLQDQTAMNQQQTALQSSMQEQFGSYMKEGGWISNDWQPQVIATFGEHKMSDLLKADPMMNTLRSGGHLAQVGYTAPSLRALETAEDGTVLDSAIRAKTDLQTMSQGNDYRQNLRHAISSTDTYADGRPVEKTDLYSVTKGRGDNQRVKEFLRTQTGDEAPQYSMQKTYKPLFSDQYKTVSKTIGAGRGERRMADMENFLAEGKMEDGGYMAMGGNLQTHWGGHPELMSYNPYIPGGGETVMFRGQSHDDTNSKGQSGIGITYGDNPVEVERGEPMTEMNDGGVVYGNMKIDQFAADQINDPKAKGKKYKNYVADLSKTEAKQNKILDKASQLALDKNVNNAFDQLTLNSSQASIIGANMKLKDIAEKKLNAAAVQNAILETAEERGLESDALAQGKLKKAKYGKTLKKAEDGDLIEGPLTAEQRARAAFNRPGDKIFDGAHTYFPERGQLPLFARMLGAKRKPSYFNPEMTNTLMNAEDRSYLTSRPSNQELSDQLMLANRNFTSYNPDLQNALMYGTKYNQPQSAAQSAAPSATVAIVDAKNPQVATTDNATGPISVTTAKASGSKSGGAKSSSKKVAAAPKAGKNSQVYVAPTPVQLTDNRGPNYNWDTLSNTLPSPTSSNPSQPGFNMPASMASSNITGVDIFGNYTGPTEPFSEAASSNKGKIDWGMIGQTALSNLSQFLRPTDQEGLDPAQLYPEMLALTTNQLEPVQAQKFQPLLQGAPSDISYQDQLNEITAQSRAAERMSQYNPEAAANLFAQVSQAKNKVLAEQFRANQARKEEVYAQNRQKLDDAQLKNLQILDNQYVRQQQAKSNTKAQALEAIKSIADKTAKNKLENRQLGVYENLYKYRFDNQGRAINFNDLQQFNIPNVGDISNLTRAQEDKIKELSEKIIARDKAGNITGSKEKTSTTKTNRNGSIVKAIKNL